MRWLALVLGLAIIAGVGYVVNIQRQETTAPITTGVGSTASGAAGASASGGTTGSTGSAKPSPSGSAFTDPCGTFDTTMQTPYPITGYWIIPTSNECTWRPQFQEIHRVGGDTVVRLAHGLSPRRVDSDTGQVLDAEGDKPDERYATCVEDGLTCVQAAEKDLKAANSGNRITWTYVYRTDEHYGDHIFRCPQMEHEIVTAERVFFRLIAPDDGTDDASCDFSSKGRGYHLILVSAGKTDSLTNLLALGDRFGIRVFPGLPLAPRDPTGFTKANPRHIGTLTTLTRRIVQDYGARFSGRASLGGVYQPFELQIRDWPDPDKVDTLKVLAEQHLIVEQELPGKPILISPYLDARRDREFAATPAEAARGFKVLARTGAGIIAPQDGRGTGKGGLFWPNWKNKPVDERLRPVVGDTTYAKAYYGGTRDYYRMMAQARQELAEEGIHVELWANIEAFEPEGDKPCARQSTRGQTDKPRLDTAVTLVGPYVSKIISYMWSDYFTCGSPSLAEQIAQDWNRPIAIQAFRRPRDIQDGLEIRGYNLRGVKVTLSWTGVDEPKVVDSAQVGVLEPGPIPGLPERVERVWIPFDLDEVPEGRWVRVGVTAPDGRIAAEPIYYQHQG
ncbi:DUF4434 domain-containing protein [Thermopolyspora sp. NPDC052614]|uniref:DUF4434 domain-containing protein n=1 Tax=Thermopolyspora sp. NPDC052614 TaxID=3155682 RepID=UPI00343914DD